MGGKEHELREYRQQLLERFAEFYPRLERAAAAVLDERWQQPLLAQGCTPHWLLAHLRDIEAQNFLPRLQRVLGEETPVLSAFDGCAWTKVHHQPEEPVSSLLAQVKRLRQQQLEILSSLPDEAWNRICRHPAAGLRTLQWWIEQDLVHVEKHLMQMSET